MFSVDRPSPQDVRDALELVQSDELEYLYVYEFPGPRRPVAVLLTSDPSIVRAVIEGANQKRS